VRDAAQGTARVVMSRLSAHGVKQMLTPVLNSLPEETQWKSRQEAIRLVINIIEISSCYSLLLTFSIMIKFLVGNDGELCTKTTL
jgi:hypothetical protein